MWHLRQTCNKDSGATTFQAIFGDLTDHLFPQGGRQDGTTMVLRVLTTGGLCGSLKLKFTFIIYTNWKRWVWLWRVHLTKAVDDVLFFDTLWRPVRGWIEVLHDSTNKNAIETAWLSSEKIPKFCGDFTWMIQIQVSKTIDADFAIAHFENSMTFVTQTMWWFLGSMLVLGGRTSWWSIIWRKALWKGNLLMKTQETLPPSITNTSHYREISQKILGIYPSLWGLKI